MNHDRKFIVVPTLEAVVMIVVPAIAFTILWLVIVKVEISKLMTITITNIIVLALDLSPKTHATKITRVIFMKRHWAKIQTPLCWVSRLNRVVPQRLFGLAWKFESKCFVAYNPVCTEPTTVALTLTATLTTLVYPKKHLWVMVKFFNRDHSNDASSFVLVSTSIPLQKTPIIVIAMAASVLKTKLFG